MRFSKRHVAKDLFGPATNVTVAPRASHSTSETIVISEADAAKIRKDAEEAVKKDKKVRVQRVYHGSANHTKVYINRRKPLNFSGFRRI